MRRSTSLHSLIAAVCAAFLALPGAAPAAEPEFYQSEAMSRLDVPFSDAVAVGDLLFIAGQIGNVPGTYDLVEGGIAPEARQAMDNIATILADNGLTFDRIVKCTVRLADIDEWAAFNEVYVTYFDPPYPARSTAGVTGLALGARVEVECIAAR